MPLKSRAEARLLLQEAARQYLEDEGASLRRELSGEAGRDPAPTPRLDRAVRERLRLRRRRTAILAAGAAAAAACFLAVLALPILFKSLSAANPPAAESPAAQPPVYTRALPVNLTVADLREDNGQSIYTLREAGGDDVIMTLEYADDPGRTDGLAPVVIQGETAYLRETPDYSLLLLEADGVRYTLTCRYHTQTLLDLAACIV